MSWRGQSPKAAVLSARSDLAEAYRRIARGLAMTMLFNSVVPPWRRSPAFAADLGALPQWRLDDLYASMDSPRFAADLDARAREAKAFAAAYRGKLADSRSADGGRAARRGGARLRGAAGPDRAAHVLRLAALRRRHQRPRAREILRRRAGEGDRRSRAICCSSSSSSTASTTPRSTRRWRRRRSAITAPGSRTSARRGRISSPTRSSNCSWKSP